MKWGTFRKSLGWILLVCVVVRWRTIECFSVEEEEERGREERGGAARFKRIRVLLCLCVMRDYIPLPNFVYACFTTLWWVYIMNRWFFDLTVTMKPPICSYVHLFNTPFYMLSFLTIRLKIQRSLCCVFLNHMIFFALCGCDENYLWLNMDHLIHQTVRIYPVWAHFIFLFHYCFVKYTPSVLRHSPLFLWKPFSLHVNFVHTFMHFYSSYSSYHALFCYIVGLISCILIQNIFYVMHHFII